MVAWAGSVVLATTGEASLRLQCIDTKPSLDWRAPRPDSVQSAGRSKDWMQCAESDDKLRYASNHPDRLMPLPAGKPPPAQCSRNKAPSTSSTHAMQQDSPNVLHTSSGLMLLCVKRKRHSPCQRHKPQRDKRGRRSSHPNSYSAALWGSRNWWAVSIRPRSRANCKSPHCNDRRTRDWRRAPCRFGEVLP